MNNITTKSNLYTFLKQQTGLLEPRLIVIYSLAGVFQFLIIASIIITVNSNSEQDLQNFLFFGISLLAFIRFNKYCRDHSHDMIESMVSAIRERFTDKTRRLSVLQFHKLGQIELNNVLTQELVHISEAAKLIAGTFTSTAVLAVSVLYLTYLSVPALLVTSIMIFLGVYVYRIYRDQIEEELIAANQKENEFFQKLRHLLDGFNEIKISDTRNNDFFYNHIKPVITETDDLKKRSNKRMNNAFIFAQTFCFILMGVMIFIFPRLFEIEEMYLIQIVTLILFLTTGPLQEVVGAFPAIERANISVRMLEKVEHFLDETELEKVASQDTDIITEAFQSLECKNLLFHYSDNGSEKTFEIGPINLHIKKGDVIFIKGGNGAGKSTFFHVLTGLYRCTQGEIVWNGRPVHDGNINLYRSNFAVIYQDMHLFDRLYGIHSIDHARVDALLKTFHIDGKTGINSDGTFKSLKLSVGQKKRLALIVAEMDDKAIHVYDEWAADQDPPSRQYFYETYLPQLKQKGKTVIAITHDDRYYHLADCLYKMEYGKLTEEKTQPVPQTPKPSSSPPSKRQRTLSGKN